MKDIGLIKKKLKKGFQEVNSFSMFLEESDSYTALFLSIYPL